MAACVSYIFKIVVFAACPNALLRADRLHIRAFVLPQEGSLELNHAGIREKQSRIIIRHQR
jgi:hypothetical protein